MDRAFWKVMVMGEETAGEFYHRLMNSDASVWADEFMKAVPGANVDKGILISWFANSYMAGYDKANGGGPLCGDHAAWLLENGK